MKITLEADPKEIADLIVALQGQLKEKFSDAVANAVIQRCQSEISENSLLESEY